MLARASIVAAAIGLWLDGAARAQESLDDLDKPAEKNAEGKKTGADSGSDSRSGKIAEVNGYADERFQASWIDPVTSPLPTRDFPALQELAELNVQLKVNLGTKAFVYGDLSVLFQGGWLFYQNDGAGNRVSVPDHDVPSLRPLVVPSELYLSWSPRPWLNFLVGRKRIVWGSGFAFNPTDLVNPPKDPTDPNFQRAGAWLARVELPFERFTVSALFAPQVLYTSYGLPSAILQYPSYLPSGETARDDGTHYLVAGRIYALIDDADINLMYFFGNQYNDGFKNKSRIGASFSRYFFTDYELHVEALFQLGSARAFVDHFCLTAPFGPGCADPLHQAVANSKLDSTTIYPRVLVGTRYLFKDESLLSLEYYYQADGYSDQEFEDFVHGLVMLQSLGGALSGGQASSALPVKFTFDPLRRHYLIASWSKPRIHDDWTVTLVLIAGLRDLSGMVSPSVSWNAKEWLQVSLFAFVPIRGIPVGQVDGKYSEYSLLPFDARGMIELRAFY